MHETHKRGSCEADPGHCLQEWALHLCSTAAVPPVQPRPALGLADERSDIGCCRRPLDNPCSMLSSSSTGSSTVPGCFCIHSGRQRLHSKAFAPCSQLQAVARQPRNGLLSSRNALSGRNCSSLYTMFDSLQSRISNHCSSRHSNNTRHTLESGVVLCSHPQITPWVSL